MILKYTSHKGSNDVPSIQIMVELKIILNEACYYENTNANNKRWCRNGLPGKRDPVIICPTNLPN